ncbi:IPT/TIG domain-containing protein [Kitasatospora sp. NPDC008115]|uniref:DUF7927 domain-containing protein n=1 Tax=Kitasatospora sp. NPDC008115 TaxID=3364022 RepID=UPI0036EBBD80
MFRSVLAETSARRTAALLTAATATLGLLTVASPAHADSVVQIAGPAGPLPVNNPYTVTLNVPNTNPARNANSNYLEIALSGAAAKVTSANASNEMWTCNFAAGSSGACWHLAGFADPVSITLTVMPTAGGTVTTDVKALDYTGVKQVGSDTLSTRIEAPAPAVTGLAPDHGPLAGGTTVTLTGTHLTGTTAVNFGSTPATAFTVDSDTRITATAPAATTPGRVDVTVTTPGGTGKAGGKYTYEEGSYVFSQTADPASGSTVKTGDKVTYSVTVAQKGAGDVKGATVTDDLSKVLDDAAYNGDAKATSGTAEVKDGKLTWTGDLPQDGSATITYSVTVNGKGDSKLHSAVTTSDAKRGTCATEKGCGIDHTVAAAGTPSPTATPTPTQTSTTGGQTPDPTASSTAPVTPGTSSTPSASQTPQTPQTPRASQTSAAPALPAASRGPVAPAAAPSPQSSGALASTGSTTLTTATISGVLLILGGLAVALSRRRRRHG